MKHYPQKIRDYIAYRKARINSGQWKKDMVDTLFYLVQGYLLFVACMIIFQRHIMYFPHAAWSERPAPGVEIVTYPTVDGLSITSWYAPPKENKPVVVMFHGNAGNISNRRYKQDFFAAHGYGFLLAEYRGYGGNEGRPTEEGLYTDARAALHWLIKDRNIAPQRIILYGESLGTGVASEMALEFKDSRALVLETPLTSIPDMVKSAYPWITPFRYLALDRYDNLSKAPYFTMPALVAHGTKDKVIPLDQGNRVFTAITAPRKKLKIIEGGGHENLGDLGLLEEMLAFSEELE